MLIFGTNIGLKKLSPSNYYGDFIIEDFQNKIISNKVTNISLSEERKTLVFCCEDYVFEYHILLNIFYVYQSKVFKQIIEINDSSNNYTSYALDSAGKLYKADKTLYNQTRPIC